MTVETLLSQLDAVQQRGSRWIARCPSHADRSPSLQIAAGERAILLKCWAGCSLDEICSALHVRKQELFFDSLSADPRERCMAAQRRAAEKAKREKHEMVSGLTIDALREADYFILSRRNIDITQWSDQLLNQELDALGAAYRLLDQENLNGQLG